MGSEHYENGMNIVVRPADPEDAASIKALNALSMATLRKIYRPNKAALDNKSLLAACLNRLVATSEGQIVVTVQWYKEDELLRVMGLGVHPDFRRWGVARELVASLCLIGQEQGATRLRLYTVKETGNVGLFARLGFLVLSEREDQFSESDHYSMLTEVEMERPLTGYASPSSSPPASTLGNF
jgi:ribosomal protein S18 acetylase RimI-like enzyme